jgi:hypothetical protein
MDFGDSILKGYVIRLVMNIDDDNKFVIAYVLLDDLLFFVIKFG